METIIAIGKHTGLEVIAEGVETEDQRAVLERFGCNGYQGFLYSPALSAAELDRWVAKRSAS